MRPFYGVRVKLIVGKFANKNMQICIRSVTWKYPNDRAARDYRIVNTKMHNIIY